MTEPDSASVRVNSRMKPVRACQVDREVTMVHGTDGRAYDAVRAVDVNTGRWVHLEITTAAAAVALAAALLKHAARITGTKADPEVAGQMVKAIHAYTGTEPRADKD